MTRRNSSISLVESALAVMMVLVCVSTLAAQKSKKEEDSTTRTLQGLVSDAGENPVQQAVVQLKDTRTLQILSFITKEDGNYHFANLKNDVEYEVKASHGGLSTAWRRVSIFDTRKIVVLNLKLEKK
jgi:uncharacterized protein YdeI (BOF family)